MSHFSDLHIKRFMKDAFIFDDEYTNVFLILLTHKLASVEINIIYNILSLMFPYNINKVNN